MSLFSYFVQECPTCGRSLEIRVAHLGRQVFCQHCGAKFFANDAGEAESTNTESLLRRAERLIDATQPVPRMR